MSHTEVNQRDRAELQWRNSSEFCKCDTTTKTSSATILILKTVKQHLTFCMYGTVSTTYKNNYRYTTIHYKTTHPLVRVEYPCTLWCDRGKLTWMIPTQSTNISAALSAGRLEGLSLVGCWHKSVDNLRRSVQRCLSIRHSTPNCTSWQQTVVILGGFRLYDCGITLLNFTAYKLSLLSLDKLGV